MLNYFIIIIIKEKSYFNLHFNQYFLSFNDDYYLFGHVSNLNFNFKFNYYYLLIIFLVVDANFLL